MPRKVSRKRGVKQEEDPTKAMTSEDLFDLAYGTISELTDRAIEDPEVREDLTTFFEHFNEYARR